MCYHQSGLKFDTRSSVSKGLLSTKLDELISAFDQKTYRIVEIMFFGGEIPPTDLEIGNITILKKQNQTPLE